MLRICLASREYPSDDHAGGIGTYTEKTARELARSGHHVTVITEARSEPSLRVEEGVRVWRLRPAETEALGRLPYARTLARSLLVARAIRSLPEPPDIVQASEHAAEAFFYSLGRRGPTRLVTRLATPTSVVAEHSRGARLSGVRLAALDFLERTQALRSDAVIAPSDAVARVVHERWGLPRERVLRVRTGVDFARRYRDCAEEPPPELEGVDYALYFGRLEERKGVHVLAQALPGVLAANPRLHFVFAGNNFLSYRGGTMQEFVERCNASHRSRLHFYPRLPQRALHPLLAGSLFVVLPSLWESLANAALEALDMGRPVVATSGSGFEEVIEHGRSGLLVPPGEVAALGAALSAMVADRPRLRTMSAAALARAADFSLDRVVQDLLVVYADVLGVSVDAAA